MKFNVKKIVVASALVTGGFSLNANAATFLNLDLNLTGWTTVGNGSLNGSNASINTYSSTHSIVVNGSVLPDPNSPSGPNNQPQPISNTYIYNVSGNGVITTIAPSSSSQTNWSSLASSIGLTTSQISNEIGTTSLGGSFGSGLTPTNYAYITRDFTLAAGSYSFGWAYVANDYQPYADGIFFSYSDTNNPSNSQFVILARNSQNSSTVAGTTGYPTGTVVVGSYGSTPFYTYNFSLSASSTYKMAFGAFNNKDTYGDPVFILTNSVGQIVGNVIGGNLIGTDDTQASLQNSAYDLRGAYTLQSAIINTGLSYDCTTFDKHGICLSAGGRVTDTVNPATNSQGALVIASYRANDNWRIGGYLDQNLSSNDARGVNLDNSNPMGGVFAVWNQNSDGTGYQVRVAAGYSDKDVTISRSVVGTAEAGKGDSSLRSQAYSAVISRGFQINDTRWIASPYLGVRYTKIKRAGYTEDSSADVTAPLTYSALSQETTTALAGVRFNGQFGDKLNVLASAGVESDIAHNTGDYAATGVDGLTPIAFNENIRHMRPVAQAGVRYAIDKRQTVGANLHYRQEAFNSTHSVTGMVNYELGF